MGKDVFGDEQRHVGKGHIRVKREFTFDYFLHETGGTDEVTTDLIHMSGMDPVIAADIAERRPFYEVTLHCVVDLDSGKVSIESAECS
jgi:hypothetical protein